MLHQHQQDINFNLIDHFYHLPDSRCVKTNTSRNSKIEVKRRQPMAFFIKILQTLSQIPSMDKFIYSECDFFPLDEEKYLTPLSFIEEGYDLSVRATPHLKNTKIPHGYMSMSPLYFKNGENINGLTTLLIQEFPTYLKQERVMEYMINDAVRRTQRFKIYGKHFISNFDSRNNLDPTTMTTHQDHILNLRNEFRRRGITKGTFVNKILNNLSITYKWDEKNLLYDADFPPHIKEMPLIAE